MKPIAKIIAKLALLALLFTTLFYDLSAASAAQAAKNPTTSAKQASRSKTELIVRYKSNGKEATARQQVKTKLKLGKLEVKKKSRRANLELLQIGDGDNLALTIAELGKDPNVEYAQPNYKLFTYALPTDDRFGEQWGLSNTGQQAGMQAGVPGVDIGALAAWELTEGSPSVLVGVLDTGIDTAHPDLAASIYTNAAEIPGNGIDDDGNGYIDDVQGYDFAHGDATVYDNSSEDKHGTHVAGIIASQANELGVRGVAPRVTLLPLKFMAGGVGYTSDAIDAIEYAQQKGVSIINMSFGGPDDNRALKDAMAASGMLFIAAAGNHGDSVDDKPIYPASFRLPNLLSATAMDNQGRLAAFAGFGSTVDIAAPGAAILSTVPGGGYAALSGTSMAAAFVTGIAALVQSAYPDLTASQTAVRIKQTATASPTLTAAQVQTAGYAQAFAALTGEQLPAPPTPAVTEDDESTGNADSGANAAVVALAVDVSPALLEQIHYGEEGINVATGNFGMSVTDLSVVAPGFVVNISRTYNSKDDRATSSLGRGWTFGFEGSLKNSSYNLKVANLPNGSAQVFVYDSYNNTYTANDSRSTLVKQADGSHILTSKDQYRYGFNPSGYLVWMEDRNGNRVQIDTDAVGKARKITDTAGRVFTLAYNEAGYLLSVTDPLGTKIQYVYDASNRLKQVNDQSGQIVATYTYDSSGYLSMVKDGLGNLLETISYNHNAGANQHKAVSRLDRFGNTTAYTYNTGRTTITDVAGRTVDKWYDSNGFVTKSQDPEGRATTVEYYLVSSKNMYGEEKSITDRYGNKTEYVRNTATGNIEKLIHPDQTFREYSYDSRNNLIREKDEMGRLTFYIYDATQTLLLHKAQPLNGTDIYTPDANPEAFAITTYDYYSDAEAARLGYKAKGLLQSETDAEGNRTTYAYDAQGNKTGVTNADGHTTQFEYNLLGWLTAQVSPSGFRTTYVYDKVGRLVKTTLDGGETAFTEYDAIGRPVQVITPLVYKSNADGTLASSPTFQYSNNSVGERLTYFPSGLLKTKTDALGNMTTYSYDAYGNLASEIKPNGAIYEYQYDSMNRLKKTLHKRLDIEAPLVLETVAYTTSGGGQTARTVTKYFSDTVQSSTTTTFDENGREIRTVFPDGTGTQMSYWPDGQVKTVKNARGNVTHYRYDGLGRQTGVWSPLDGGKYTYTGTEYDKAGRVTGARTGKDAVSANTVPSADRVMWSRNAYTPGGQVALQTDSAGGRTAYAYDDDGVLVRKEIYTSAEKAEVTLFENNHLGKPVVKKQLIRSGDLLGNDFGDDDETSLLTTFDYDEGGNLVGQTTPDGVVSSMVYDVLGRLTQTRAEGLDEQGKPVELVTSAVYNWAGQPLSQTDAQGRATRFEYDLRGFLKQQTDALDGVTRYEYDRGGRKVAEVSPQQQADGLGSRTEYMYDKMSRVQLITEHFNAKTVHPTTYAWISTPTALVTKAYQYDAGGNVEKELDGEGYAAGSGATVEARIKSGYGTVTTYNAAGLPASVLDPVSAQRGLAFTMQYLYDGAGRKIGTQDQTGVICGVRYDDAGRVIAETVRAASNKPQKTLVSNLYDWAGHLLEQTDGNGNKSTYTYNAFGQLRESVEPGDASIAPYTMRYQYDVRGLLAQTIDSADVVRLTAYDPQGRVIEQTEQTAAGQEAITTTMRYDRVGNKRFETDGNGNAREYVYDALNRLTETKISFTNTSNVSTTQSTTYGYDKNGNELWEQNWLGNRTTYAYDDRNRLISVTDATGTMIRKLEYNNSDVQVTEFDALNYATQYTFDRNNRQIAATSPENKTTAQAYDNRGLVESSTDGNGHTTRYTYDEMGNLSAVVNALGDRTTYTYDLNGNRLTERNAAGQVSVYEYNAANQLLRRVDAGGRTGKAGSYAYDPAKTESYTYTASGQMATKLDRNGNTTTYVYDAHNRLISQTVTGPTLSLPEKERRIAYTYDNNGNQLTMTDGTGVTSRTYDALNRVVTKTSPGIGTTTFEMDVTSGLTAGYVGETATDPKGNVTTKVYDKVGRLYQVRDGATVQATYEYNADGSRKTLTYASGAKETYAYYKDKQLKTLNNYQGATLLDTYAYTYDNAGNQETKSETVNGVAKGTTNYVYDVLNRLQQVTEPGGKVTQYAFDTAGNRSSERVKQGASVTTTEYTYNEQNRLLATTDIQSSGEIRLVRYTYDNNGNMIARSAEATTKYELSTPPEPTFGIFIYGQANPNPRISSIVDNVARYEYDGFNQMIQVSTGSGGSTYQYNGEGLRVRKTVDGVTTMYLYEYDQVVLETDGNGKQTARNLYGLNLVSRTMGADKYFYLYNGHADVTALISPTGTIAATYTYDAFGNITSSSGSVSNPIRYAGYQYDEESSLYYLNARYYDPKLARFLTEDTYRGQVNDPLSLNLYTYVHNEPIMYWDPTGHAATTNAPVSLRTVVESGYGGTVKWSNKDQAATITINGIPVVIKADGKDAGLVNGKMVINPDTLDRLFNAKSNSQNSVVKMNIDTSATTQKITTQTSVTVPGGYTYVSTPKTITNDYKPTEEVKKIINEIKKEEKITVEQIVSIVNVIKFSCVDEQCVDPNQKNIDNMTTQQFAGYMTSQPNGWLVATSIGADLAPIVGNVKSAVEVVSGKDAITGEKLSATDRWVAAAGIIIPQLKTLRKADKVLDLVKGAGDVAKIPGVVQNRINIANGPTRFSPSQNAGWEHVVDRHFTLGKNAGQFTVSQDEVKSILGRKDVIQTPATVLDSGQYSRVVNTGQVVGIVKPSIPDVGGTETTWIQILTDSRGNLITTFPVPAPK